MRSRMNDTVSANEVYDLAGGILTWALALVDHGPKCTVRALLLVLFLAASRAGSISDAARRLRRAPSDQAIRNALVEQLPATVPQLERKLNLALAEQLPKGLLRQSRALAIDFSQISYYGRPWKHQRELRRGKRKAGTTRFHCYATLCVVHRGERFTLAMTYVWEDDSQAAVVQRLLERAREIGLRCRYLLLDRGFYGLEVVRYLKRVRCPFLMPVVHRGRRSKRPLSQLKGTRRFLGWKRSGFADHAMKNRTAQTTVRICVACRKNKHGQSRPLVFAYWGFSPGSAAWVAQTYRKRYGIETSYRQMNQGRARTCSRDPRLRLLLAGIALLLRNVWVWLHRMVLGRVRGKGIELRLDLLRLRTMLLLLQRCAEACLGTTESAVSPAPTSLPATSGP
jgi:Transposase DDE domain